MPAHMATKDLEWHTCTCTPEVTIAVDELIREKEPVKRVQAASRLRKLRADLKKQFYKKRAEQLTSAAEKRQVDEIYRIMQEACLSKPKGANLCPPESLREHFQKHFSCLAVPTPSEVTEPEKYPWIYNHAGSNITINETCPSLKEIRSGFNCLKNGKAIGIDGLLAEFIKRCSSGFIKWSAISGKVVRCLIHRESAA